MRRSPPEIAADALAGLSPVPMSKRDARSALASWRRRFVPEVLARTGRPAHLGYEWHAYTYGFTPASTGDAALAACRATPPGELLVLSAWTSALFGFRCSGAVPDLSGLRLDLLVTDPDLRWTAVFTHEREFGPYFQRGQQ